MIFVIAAIWLVVMSQSTLAANKYVLASASGAANGSDWTNAYTSLPGTLTRGDTYYIGNGSYGAYVFNDAESGTTLITIKKATVGDHGTETGWSSTFAQQAAFSNWQITTGYWFFDGQSGTADTVSSYGFYITPSNCAVASKGIDIYTTTPTKVLSTITAQYVAIEQCGAAYDVSQYGIDFRGTISAGGTTMADTITFRRIYSTNAMVNVRVIQIDGVVLEDSYFGPNWSSAGNHGESLLCNGSGAGQVVRNMIVRNNIIINPTPYAFAFHKGTCEEFDIYNNVVDGGNAVAVFGNADSATADVVLRVRAHHNTIKNTVCSSSLAVLYPGTLTNAAADKSFAYNNLIYNTQNCTFPAGVSSTVTHDYNAWFDHQVTVGGGDAASEANGQITTGNPFQSSPNQYRLQLATNAGMTLGAPFNVDAAGVTRGADGTWDRGAYEYTTDTTVRRFSPLFNLRR